MTDVEDLEIEDKIHEFTREQLDPDDLYYLRQEMDEVGQENLACRVDIEYRNALRYGDYHPAFIGGNLVSMLMLLGKAQYEHVAAGNRTRADIANDLADTIADHFYAWADERDVSLEEYLGIPLSGGDDIEPDHSERMEKAKHDKDAEVVSSEAEMGPLDEDEDRDELDFGPDAVEEKELHPSPQTPDTPDGPGGGSGDDDAQPG